MPYIVVNGNRIDVPYNIAVDLVDRMAALTKDDCVVIEWTDNASQEFRIYIPYEATVLTVVGPVLSNTGQHSPQKPRRRHARRGSRIAPPG